MIENGSNNVFAAFEILLEEIEVEIEIFNKAATEAVERRDYESVREVIEYADQTTVFREKIVFLRNEWEILLSARRGTPVEEILPLKPHNLGRLQRGVRTREIAYYKPILRALNELGGAGKTNDVLEWVEKSMQNVLKTVDYEPLTSGTEMLRWRNTAQWARNAMVKEGLLKLASPRGIWEISDAGRAYLMS